MRIAICDDVRAHAAALEALIRDQQDLQITTNIFTSGEDLLAYYAQHDHPYDALFLDMEMGGLNGIETAGAIRALDRRVEIVFVTSHTKYMKASFLCHPFNYLVKPVDPEELALTLRKLAQKFAEERQSITFSDNKRVVRLYCDEIIYCESDSPWVVLHTASGDHRYRIALTELEKQLAPGLFARANKAFLVNLNEVRTIDGYDILLRDGKTVLPLGRTYAKSFKHALLTQQTRRLGL